MKRFEITIGSGFIHPYEYIVEVEDYECAQDAFDKMVDKLEKEDNESIFILPETIDEYYEDQYSVGGNHGRYVFHDGIFYIKEV